MNYLLKNVFKKVQKSYSDGKIWGGGLSILKKTYLIFWGSQQK